MEQGKKLTIIKEIIMNILNNKVNLTGFFE